MLPLSKGRQRMGEMVGSAVVQEVVSGAFSIMRNNREEMASRSCLLERLKMAYLELKFALERSREMPITEVSLLQRRMELKHAFQECRDVLRVNLEEGTEQRVLSSPKRFFHAVKAFFNTGKGSMSGSCVTRFELFAEKADKFVRDVESGCSLARYRFSCPLITQLLEGKYLRYRTVSGSQTRTLYIAPSCLEDYGAVAFLLFDFKDAETPMKCFHLRLMLRLSESTDIVGISTECLQSLEPQFNPVVDVASGELAQISTQVGFFMLGPAQRETIFNMTTEASRIVRQEPLCCISDELEPFAKNILSSELTERFPEQVSVFLFRCSFSAADYNLQSSTVETNRNTIIRAWPILQLSVAFLPHFLWKTEADEACTFLISDMAEFVPVLAVDCFALEPERTEFTMVWCAPHGRATFTVSKPTTEEMGRCSPKVGDKSNTRRVSKRKR